MRQIKFQLLKEESITLPIFPNVESLYYWLTESTANPDLIKSIQNVDYLIFSKDDTIICEWLGCEFNNELFSFKAESYHYVKLAKFVGDIFITSHVGWIHNCILPISNDWEDYNDIISENLSDYEYIDIDQYFKVIENQNEKSS